MMGPQYQVEVVGHEAIAEQVHRQAGACVDDRLDEGVVIAGLVEDSLAAVAPIEGVIPHATDRGASGSRHAIMIVDEVPAVNKGVCPRFFPCPRFCPARDDVRLPGRPNRSRPVSSVGILLRPGSRCSPAEFR